MAVTLTVAADLTQDKLRKGVIQEMVKVSPILKKLPFKSVTGSAIAYVREDVDNLGSVQFRAPDGIWTESTAQFDQFTAALTVLGADCDVPNLIGQTQSNINDQMGEQVKIKSRLMAWKYEDCAVYGDVNVANQFDGMHNLVDTTNMSLVMAADATGAPLTLDKLDELIDKMPNGCDALLMNKNIRRRLTAKLRALGSYTTSRDDYGNQWEVWRDIPILVSDHVLQTELCAADTGLYSAKTGGSTSSIFAVKFGEDGLCGLQNGEISYETWDKLETKDASRTRVKWYCGMVLYSTLCLARLGNITDAAMS
jgi:hypothetical protein